MLRQEIREVRRGRGVVIHVEQVMYMSKSKIKQVSLDINKVSEV